MSNQESKTLEYGVTHEVVLQDGTKMWVKAGATRTIGTKLVPMPNAESEVEIWNDLVDEVNSKALDGISKAVRSINNKGRR